MTTYRVLGIVSAERACECCGNSNLERNVILCNESGEKLYVGSDCAAQLLYGRKSKGNSQSVVKLATVAQKACEFLAAGSDRKKVAEYVYTRTGRVDLYHEVLNGAL